VSFAEIADSFFKPAVRDLVPYEPGKPVEEVQRELGLERVVKLASNEGPFGPFPEAREALVRGVEELNRYPDGGSWRLRTALAELHDVRFEEVAPGAGSDGVVDYLSPTQLGVRSTDGLFRWVHGLFGTVVLGHHLFDQQIDGQPDAERAWTIWLDRTFGISNFQLRAWLTRYLRWYFYAFGAELPLPPSTPSSSFLSAPDSGT